MGLYPGDPGPLGAECAGEIAAVGEGVNQFAVGDAVVAIAPGSFAGYVTTRAEWVVPKPVRMSFDEAVTVPVAFITAHFTLNHLAKIQAGDRVLIHAAAGGVGLAAVTLAQRAGAEIFATAGSPEKRAFLKSLGVSHVMDSRSLGFADEIMRITGGRGVDVVLNSLADQFVDRSFEVIARNGRFLEIGKRGLWDQERVAKLNRNIQYFVVDWSVDARNNPSLIESMLRELMAAFDRGELEIAASSGVSTERGESGVPFHGAWTSHRQGGDLTRGNAPPAHNGLQPRPTGNLLDHWRSARPRTHDGAIGLWTAGHATSS